MVLTNVITLNTGKCFITDILYVVILYRIYYQTLMKKLIQATNTMVGNSRYRQASNLLFHHSDRHTDLTFLP